MDASETFHQLLYRLGTAKKPLASRPKGLHHRLPFGLFKQHDNLEVRVKHAGLLGQLEARRITFDVAADQQNVEWLIRQESHHICSTACRKDSGKAT